MSASAGLRLSSSCESFWLGPLVLVLLWALGTTLQYVPPVMP